MRRRSLGSRLWGASTLTISPLVLIALLGVVPNAVAIPDYPPTFPYQQFATVGESMAGTDVLGDVSVFNGALGMRLPLFGAPVSERLQLWTEIRYDSKSVWRLSNAGTTSSTDDHYVYRGSGELGAGWHFNFGRIMPVSAGFGVFDYYVQTPDGALHKMYVPSGATAEDKQYVSRDGSFLRLSIVSGTFKLFHPDGTIVQYQHSVANPPTFNGTAYYPTLIVDPFGNRLRLAYHAAPRAYIVQSVVDTIGRSVETFLISESESSLEKRGLIERVRIPAEGGGTLDIGFTYSVRTINTPTIYSPQPDITVAVLRTVTMPEGLTHRFNYAFTGELNRRELPTGAVVQFNWLNFFQGTMALGRGVDFRALHLDGDTTNLNVERRWTYGRNQATGCPGGYRVSVTDPSRRTRIYEFGGSPATLSASSALLIRTTDYSVPFVPQCQAPPAGVSMVRETRIKWQLDDYPGILDQNPRPVQIETTYTVGGHFQRQDACGWNGLGSFGVQVVRASDAETRSLVREVTPLPCQWNLGFEARYALVVGGLESVRRTRMDIDGRVLQTVESEDLAPSGLDPAQCDNSGLPSVSVTALGRLAEEALVAPAAHWPSQVVLGLEEPVPPPGCGVPSEHATALAAAAGDVDTSWTYWGSQDSPENSAWGQPRTMTIAGGDPHPDTGIVATFGFSYEWSAGVLASVSASCVPWKLYDVTVDATTGRAISSRTPAGLETRFTFDGLGRVTAVTPVAPVPPPPTGPTAEAELTIAYPTPTTINIERAAVGEQAYVTLDTMGRTAREERRLADGNLAARFSTRDVLGRPTFTSEWLAAGSVPRSASLSLTGTTVSYNLAGGTTPEPLGRPTSVTHADGSKIAWQYDGLDVVRTLNGINVPAGSPGGLTSTLAVTRDGLGRDVLTEQAGQATTSFQYAHHGELARVDQGAQVRTWTRNALARVTSTSEPEFGTTTYSHHDALGMTCSPSLIQRFWDR